MTAPRDPNQDVSGPNGPDSTVEAPRGPGPFTDLVPHARGGLGEVFRATDPELHRTVAVKRLLARHAGNAASSRRFLLEAEVTARLEHPGVVPVYRLFRDTDDQPAYAMRFVAGQTLAAAIAAYHAGPADAVTFRRLLQAFLQVCQTVAYAHSRGVIHRDLKPSNVMLGTFGETLVLDWGLAKVVGRPEDAREAGAGETLVPSSGESGPGETAMGSAVGTPAYMSPEQAAGRWDVVAQPSDVFGLGAVLYTLLTGRPPLDKGNWPEMQQKIQRGDFPRPRQVKPDVPRPLEAVCLKAMAVDPPARYASVTDLAADVEHWLADEPVGAYREPLATRARRWAKRNRTLVTAAGVLLVAAVAGLSAGLVLLERKNREIDGQRRTAETAQARAVAINKFLVEDLLRQADPEYNPRGSKITVRELLDQASARLERSPVFAGQLLVEADLRMVVGEGYDGLEVCDQAQRHYQRAWDLRTQVLGPDHRDTLAARNRHVWATHEMGQDEEAAEREARAAAEACTRLLGEADEETGRALAILGQILADRRQLSEGEAVLRRSVEVLRSAGAPTYWTMFAENGHAVALFHMGRGAEAEAVHRRMLADRLAEQPPPHDYLVLQLKRNLAADILRQGKFGESEPLLRESAGEFGEVIGKDNDQYLTIRNNLGYALEGLGRDEEAGQEYVAVLAGRRRLNHPNVQRTLAFLARLSARQGKWPAAAGYLAELVHFQAPDPKPAVGELAKRYTTALAADAEPAAAAPLLRQCREAAERSLWLGDWLSAELASRYGDCLRRQGKYEEAEPILVDAANDAGKAIGVPPDVVAATRNRVAELYDARGKPAEAARWRAER